MMDGLDGNLHPTPMLEPSSRGVDGKPCTEEEENKGLKT